MTLREKYRMLRHTMLFYANEDNYKIGGSRSVFIDNGQRAREIMEITDGQETPDEEA